MKVNSRVAMASWRVETSPGGVLVGAAINSESKVVEFQATKILDV